MKVVRETKTSVCNNVDTFELVIVSMFYLKHARYAFLYTNLALCVG